MTEADELSPGSLALRAAVVEVEDHVSQGGWDQPGRLFALVPTWELVAAKPDLAVELGLLGEAHSRDALTPVEQEVDLATESFEGLLGRIAWPTTVSGVVAVVERMVLPPEAESDVPEDATQAATYAAEHPDREDVRIAAGVTRSGAAHCVLRLRSHDDGQHLVHGPELVPRLVSALRETLEAGDDEGDQQ